MTYLNKISIIAFVFIIIIIQSSNVDGSDPNVKSDLNSKNTSRKGASRIKKTHLIVATVESAPFMMKRKSVDLNDTSEWYGYCMDFFEELIKHLPYEVTYDIYQVSDNKFGSKIKQVVLEAGKDGKPSVYKKLERWSGLVGDLQQGKAHLALAPLAVMAERELAIDFTVPFYDLVGIQILLKKPEVPQDWFKFLTVLDGEVWFSMTIAYFLTSFVIFLFDRLSPYSHKNALRIQRMNRKGGKDGILKSTLINTISNQDEKSFGLNSGSKNLSFMNNQDKTTFQGNHLVRSHQLFIGSLGTQISTINETKRRSSSFFQNGIDSLLNRTKESTLTTGVNSLWSPEMLQQGENSEKFDDFPRDVDFQKEDDNWETESIGHDDGKPDFGLRDSLWFCITSLTPQGGGEAPQNLSGRVVAGAWWLFCFIIIASYTANLAAFLTVSRLDIPIESLDDLAKQYRIKYAPVDGTAEQTYFERMAYIEEIFYNIWKEMSLNDSLSEEERSKFAVWDYPISDKFTKIWAQIQQVGIPTDIDAGLQRVKNSNLDDGFALLVDANTVKHAVMTDCSLKAVGDEFSRKPIALGVRKGDDQFRDELSYAILKLINQRFMEVLREKWWTNNPNKKTCDNNDESEGISVENIGGVFVIIFAGVILSFLVWAIERFLYNTKIGVSQDLIRKL